MPRNTNRNKPLVTQFRERHHATQREMVQIALLARKYAKDDGRSESSFDDMDRAWDELKRRKNPNRPNGGRTRRTRGGDEVNDENITAVLADAKKNLRPAPPLRPRDVFGKVIRGQARKTRRNRK